jgi:hypothetical protein
VTLPSGPDPEHIAELVRACPLVADLHAGEFGEAATYLPHRRVTGVQLRPGEVGVHVTARYPASITEVDTQLRAALAGHLAGMALTITIEDYAPRSAPLLKENQ